MQCRVLGALAIVGADGEVIHVGSRVQRALLAVLLVKANEPVSADGLCAVVWPDNPPTHAREGLRVHVHQLRRRVGRDRLTHGPAGYQLTVTAGELDAMEFVRLVEEARALGAPAARGLLRRALGLWRGSAYAGIDGVEAVRAEAAMLDERRLAAYEECFEIELSLGLHGEIGAELRALAGEHPFRERLRSQLMLALYRSDRQAEALAVFEETRRLLADELGVDPGKQLRDLHERILHDDPTLAHSGQVTAPGGTGTSKSPPSTHDAPKPPSQLPAPPPDFTGRRAHLERLDQMVKTGEATGTVVITALAGMAGVGKTALASFWAHTVRDRFPDGQLYINLRGYAQTPPLRPIDALASLLRALDVPPDRIPLDLDEATGLYRTTLTGRRLLLLLDNARSADQVRPLLPTDPESLALVTSRDRLSGLVAIDGATRITLDVLRADESHALLRTMLGDDVVEHEPEAVIALAVACGYLPLALRIAAANLLDERYPTVAAYVDALHSDDSLNELDVEDDSQASIRAAFTLSYGGLETDSRRLFRLLGLAPGSSESVEAVAALAGITPKQAGVLLRRLLQANLVGQGAADRYYLHDLIRAYAAERAVLEESANDRQTAIQRLFDHYLYTADAAARRLYPQILRLPLPSLHAAEITFTSDTQAMEWLEVELANLVASVTYGAAHGPWSSTWRLADSLRGYFRLRPHAADWLAVAQAGLAAAESCNDLRAQVAAQSNIAAAYRRVGHIELAVHHLTLSVSLAREAKWREGEATGLDNLASIHRVSGRQTEAIEHYTRALAIQREAGWRHGEAVCTGNLALVFLDAGKLREAAQHILNALPLFKSVGSRTGEAVGFANLGEIHHLLGNLDLATNHLEQALAIHREVGDRPHEADTMRIMAEVHCTAGRHTHAMELIQAALALECDDQLLHHYAISCLARVYCQMGNMPDSNRLFEEALRLARGAKSRRGEALALIGLASQHADIESASRRANEALTISRNAGLRLVEGQALTALAEIQLNVKPEAARSAAAEAVAIHDETGHRYGLARTHLLLGRAFSITGRSQEALSHLRDALAIFESMGIPETSLARQLIRDLGVSAPE